MGSKGPNVIQLYSVIEIRYIIFLYNLDNNENNAKICILITIKALDKSALISRHRKREKKRETYCNERPINVAFMGS